MAEGIKNFEAEMQCPVLETEFKSGMDERIHLIGRFAMLTNRTGSDCAALPRSSLACTRGIQDPSRCKEFCGLEIQHGYSEDLFFAGVD